MVVPALLSVLLMLQPPVDVPTNTPSNTPSESAPLVCPRNTTSCATGCVPLGQSCPSAAELNPTSVTQPEPPPPAETDEARAARAEMREVVSERRSPRRQGQGPCLEPLSDWKLRRMGVGFGLAVPGAAMLAPVLFSALSIPDYTKIEGRTRNVAATFGILGAGLILAAIIAPRLMRRREVACGAETCSLTLRF